MHSILNLTEKGGKGQGVGGVGSPTWLTVTRSWDSHYMG